MRAPTQVNMLEAKNQLSRLVKEAAAGREIIIASNGTPMAKLGPIGTPRRLRGWGALKVSAARLDAAFAPGVDLQVAQLFRGRRK